MTTKDATTAVAEELGEEQLGLFLYQMMLMRRFEERTGEMYTKGKVRGFLHLYTGQEACAVGAIHALEPRDQVITHYRDHGHALARGVDPKRIMAELFGKVGGTNAGRGGSMHIMDASLNFMGGYAIVGGHLPMAVGLALSNQLKKNDALTMCIFGDGAVGEGEFHEALNLAALWKLPVLWFCENNLYGMGVPLGESIANDIYKIAAGYKIPSVRINGMSVLEVYAETKKAVEHVRSGKGPYFVEAMTYRYRGHSMADPELYRTKDEIEEHRRRDAIESFKDYMKGRRLIDDARIAELDERVENDVQAAIDFAEESPQPEISTLLDHIYKESPSG
ncbi:MAG TPA: pyruvate dehydrogenase (acetyl-transferring) E1 component subunit alpha [Tepidiformaceae bacterium]|nr:pyruvate dehydrogenase (acetyl-transferring) E1 component subunit alpha [Tepidiformaceae bacterium]